MSEKRKKKFEGVLKTKTGIQGFDEITNGGLPQGRPTLIVGGPGSGKTLFAMEFLIKGAIEFNEPGVFVSFEESEDDLRKNVVSLGFDLKDLEKKHLIAIDFIKVEANEVIETGEYDLEALFVRLGYAIDSIGAKRIAIDTIESIFSSFRNELVLRSELRRLFRFLKSRGMTAVITGEKGEITLTRNGLEEYVSDAVIILDNRVINNISTRRLRVLKYRGSSHGSNEYPFIIDAKGFSVLPITSVGLNATASKERISSGISALDRMLGGAGFYKGSTILVSGSAGTGKTSVASEFAVNACREGRKVLYYTFEESPSQLTRNMASIGLDLKKYIDAGQLRIYADRPTIYGLETHLVKFHNLLSEYDADVVIIDPLSSLATMGNELEVRSTLVRLIDYLKMNGITAMMTDLIHYGDDLGSYHSLISSLIDSWIWLESREQNEEAVKYLRIIKSRGMAHSQSWMEMEFTSRGIRLTHSKPHEENRRAGRT